jgi:hypothetical protein
MRVFGGKARGLLVVLPLALALLWPAAVSAADYAAGVQFMAPFWGLSVKLPADGMTLQPIIVARSDAGGSSYTIAGRFLFNLGQKNGIARYWGAGVGLERDKVEKVGANLSLGAELHHARFPGAPSLEVALYAGREGSGAAPFWGTAVNFGWHFWF